VLDVVRGGGTGLTLRLRALVRLPVMIIMLWLCRRLVRCCRFSTLGHHCGRFWLVVRRRLRTHVRTYVRTLHELADWSSRSCVCTYARVGAITLKHTHFESCSS